VYTTTLPAYSFNGTTDFIDLGADKPSDLTGDITIGCWIRPEGWGGGGYGRIITNKYLGNNDGFYLGITNNASKNAVILESATLDGKLSGDDSITLNTWQHILATRESDGTTNFYINGIQSGVLNQDSGTPEAGTTNTFIGNNNIGDRAFDGQIKNLKI